MKQFSKKAVVSIILALALAFIAVIGAVPKTTLAAGEIPAGTYEGTSTAKNGTEYVHTLTINEDGTYTCVTVFAMGGDSYTQTENGTVSAEGNKLSFHGLHAGIVPDVGMDSDEPGDSEGVLDGNVLTVERYASIFAKTMGGAKISIEFAKEVQETFADELQSGTYEISVELNMGMPVTMKGDVKVNKEAKTVEIWRTTNSGEYQKRSDGTLAFDETTGVYTISYSNPEGQKTTFTYNAEKKALDFTSAAYFGKVALNTTDENGNFIPYSAPLKEEKPEVPEGMFSDVLDEKQPFFKPIYWAAENGVVKGFGDGTFGPDKICTRTQFVMILWRLAGRPEAGSASGFKDVDEKMSTSKAISWAVEQGIIKGFAQDNTFRPEEPVTRCQVMIMLWRWLGRPEAEQANPFADIRSGDVGYDAILWGSEAGIIKGINGNFVPSDNCLRSQIVIIFYRCVREDTLGDRITDSIRGTVK